jgi:hypothetical protein
MRARNPAKSGSPKNRFGIRSAAAAVTYAGLVSFFPGTVAQLVGIPVSTAEDPRLQLAYVIAANSGTHTRFEPIDSQVFCCISDFAAVAT